jgi:hypothetical protein
MRFYLILVVFTLCSFNLSAKDKVGEFEYRGEIHNVILLTIDEDKIVTKKQVTTLPECLSDSQYLVLYRQIKNAMKVVDKKADFAIGINCKEQTWYLINYTA